MLALRVLVAAIERQHAALLSQTTLALKHLREVTDVSHKRSLQVAKAGVPWSLEHSRFYGLASAVEDVEEEKQPDTERRFVDRIRVNVRAGNGGTGCTSYHRGRLQRKGYADGGNGGRGGDVIFQASDKVYDLGGITTTVSAERGGSGTSKNQVGSRGKDKVVLVPVGTVVRSFQRRVQEPVRLAAVAELADDDWRAWEDEELDQETELASCSEREGDASAAVSSELHGLPEPEVSTEEQDQGGPIKATSEAKGELKGQGTFSEYLDQENLGRMVEAGTTSGLPTEEDDRIESGSYASNTGRSLERPVESDVKASKGSGSRTKGPVITDLTKVGQRFVAAVGGSGGKGNASTGRKGDKPWFKRKVGQLQINEHETGEHGQQLWLELELKMLADVGLVGMPNAGKSTLLAALSPAKPAVGSYAFTTLRPHIGTVECDEWYAYTIADIPGLIEGAHENRGLGHNFLRHVERTRVLAYVLDMAGGQIKAVGRAGASKPNPKRPWEQLEDLMRELEHYEEGLTQRPSIVVANKMDEPGASQALEELRARTHLPVHPTCAVLGEGTEELKRVLEDIVARFQGGQ